MLIAVLAYAGVYTLSRKALPWMVRRHPGSRNVAAFVVESVAAIGVANALSLVAAMWYPSLRPDAPALNALLAGTFALGMHYLASDVATATHPLYLPFLLGGLAFMVVPRSMSHAVGFGMLLIGAAVAFLKYQDLRRGSQEPVRDAPRA
jgi:hypothetical protein